MSAVREHPCACGCGESAQGKFRKGHAMIAPAAMTYERALAIAVGVLDANPELQWSFARASRADPSSEGVPSLVRSYQNSASVRANRPSTARLTDDDVAAVHRLTAEGRSTNEIALQLGISSRAVTRVRSRLREAS